MKKPVIDSDPRESAPAPSRARAPRQPWVSPAIEELPPLRHLTLQSDIGGGPGAF